MNNPRLIDGIDRKILAILQENGRTPNAEIARRVGMAPSAVFERIRKLEAQGVIRAYEARLDPRALGLDTVAFVLVRVDERLRESPTGERLKEIPGVQEVHHIAGEDCYLLKVRTENTDALGRLLRERIGAIDSVRSTRTTIVLGSVKESASLPLPDASPPATPPPPESQGVSATRAPRPAADPGRRDGARRPRARTTPRGRRS
jgi:Lrp/AsnC family leucine-responsive transcriptional regulator